MTGLAVRWLVVLALLAGSYWMGDHHRNNAWLAKQAKAERQAKADYEAEVKRGDAAVGVLVLEARTLQNNFQNLTEKFNGLSKRIPLVVGVRAGAADSLRPLPDTCGQVQPRPGDVEPSLSRADGALLTAGAVWMWNSALAGTDQPSGACGSLDTTEAACAVATTLDLDDAWDNHRTNAQRCAEDRLAHQRLIDFVKTRDAQK